jgi:lysozyme
MNDGLTTGESGQKLVKAFESCLKRLPGSPPRFTTYICPAGVLTIGWGHTKANGRQIKPGDVWTQGECDAALRDDLKVAERAVRRHVKVDLTQHQFEALVSFTMNAGEGALAKSTILRKVNAKDFDGAANAFAAWNKAKDPHTGELRELKGLTRRRAAEADLFREVSHDEVHGRFVAESADDTEPMPQAVEPPAGTVKSMITSKIGNGQIAILAGTAIETGSKVNDAITQANAAKQGAKDLGVFDVLGPLVAMPTFWIAVAVIVIACFAWYWRRQHAQAGI